MTERITTGIIRGDVPESVKEKRVVSLDWGLLISGSKVSGVKIMNGLFTEEKRD